VQAETSSESRQYVPIHLTAPLHPSPGGHSSLSHRTPPHPTPPLPSAPPPHPLPQVAVASSWREGELEASCALGLVCEELGQQDAAAACHERCLALAQELRRPTEVKEAYAQLVHVRRGGGGEESAQGAGQGHHRRAWGVEGGAAGSACAAGAMHRGSCCCFSVCHFCLIHTFHRGARGITGVHGVAGGAAAAVHVQVV
jgi:hypothetical protein